jgi:hypothetical protein
LVLVEFREESRLRVDQRFAGFGGNRFVGFQSAVAANMNHDVAALREHAADEQAAMAVSRVLLAANQGHAESLHAGFKPCDPRLEAGVVAQTAIKNAAFGVVVGRIGRPSAEFRPEKEIPDSGFLQRSLHQFLIELRDVLRVGRTARIDHYLNLVLAE